MSSPKMLMAVAALSVLGALVGTAVYALVLVLLGESARGALLSGVAFIIVFPPVFWFGIRIVERRNQRRLGVSAGLTPAFDNEPVCVAEILPVAGSADSVAAAVENWIAALKGQPRRETRADGSVHIGARLGSRLAARMFGLSSSRGRRSIPMRVDVTVISDGDGHVELEVTACSDEGWYLLRLPSFEAEYRQAIDARISLLKESLPK